jgi:acyl-coenzyme A synthetase/AMP-(fatty) acid ligase
LLAQFLALAHQHFLGFEFLSFVFKSGFSASPKMSEDKKAVAETKLSLLKEKNLGFLESISKTNTEKITREILEGLSEDTGDSDSYDAESGGEDSED